MEYLTEQVAGNASGTCCRSSADMYTPAYYSGPQHPVTADHFGFAHAHPTISSQL